MTPCPERYRQILRQWISWAVSNGIPFSNLRKFAGGGLPVSEGERLQDVPYGERYIMMARIEHLNGDITHELTGVVTTLRPESSYDTDEIGLWVQNLLQRIHREVRWIDLELHLQVL